MLIDALNLPEPSLPALAMLVPASGIEAEAWKVRGLAEVLLHAVAFGDEGLVSQVDSAAAKIPSAPGRFVKRLRSLRNHFGSVPARYPNPVKEDLPARADWDTLHAALRLGTIIDALETGPLTEPETPRVSSAAEVAESLREASTWRPTAVKDHPVTEVSLDWRLIRRGWFCTNKKPTFIYAARSHSESQLAIMYGLHAGTHMDHLALVIERLGPRPANELQFGRGLEIAESVAMAVELSSLVTSSYTMEPARREMIRSAVIERISRVPGMRDQLWGIPEARVSPVLMEAIEMTPTAEFRFLPRLAGSYLTGPFEIARRRFRDPLIPEAYAAELDRMWRDAGEAAGCLIH